MLCMSEGYFYFGLALSPAIWVTLLSLECFRWASGASLGVEFHLKGIQFMCPVPALECELKHSKREQPGVQLKMCPLIQTETSTCAYPLCLRCSNGTELLEGVVPFPSHH